MSTPAHTLSVALCTYNGMRYLPEQLASIIAQTRLPDELVLVDDCSTDDTVAYLQHWAATAPFPVHIYPNEQNLGSTKSFERAVTHCTGDIVVLSDQDDVWRADRLQKTADWFAAHPAMDAVFSDADLIDDDSRQTGHRIWEVVQFTPEAQQQWQAGKGYELLFSGYVVTGATMAIRRSALASLLPFPTHVQYLIHDAWMSLVLALKGRIGFINEPLIQYRQHSSQQVGFKPARAKVTLADRLRRDRTERMEPILKLADRYQKLYELLRARTDIDPQRLARLAQMADHLKQRVQLPVFRVFRWPSVLAEAARGRYQLFPGHWWKTVLGDLLEP
ncbi:glycosyltransferase family 2 protein [Fibrella aestuarina]|nr:glycosyltransferase family 2 protein [Fibrella aestuarina]